MHTQYLETLLNRTYELVQEPNLHLLQFLLQEVL